MGHSVSLSTCLLAFCCCLHIAAVCCPLSIARAMSFSAIEALSAKVAYAFCSRCSVLAQRLCHSCAHSGLAYRSLHSRMPKAPTKEVLDRQAAKAAAQAPQQPQQSVPQPPRTPCEPSHAQGIASSSTGSAPAAHVSAPARQSPPKDEATQKLEADHQRSLNIHASGLPESPATYANLPNIEDAVRLGQPPDINYDHRTRTTMFSRNQTELLKDF